MTVLNKRRAARARGASPAAKWGVAAFILYGTIGASARAANAPRDLDPARLSAAGLRVLEGRYVRLVTDLPASPAVDELPKVFDAAIPLWCKYFDVPERRIGRTQWLGFVVKDREKFAPLGLLPAERPDFPSGYARGSEFWLAEQTSDYYRRHLVLHEGTHAFMHTMLGGAGPPWYMEGIAELLATHDWRDGKLRLNVMPASRDDVPMWGRIKLVRDAVKEGTAWPLERVLKVDNSQKMPVDEYAWVWALSALLDGHPKYQERFRSLRGSVTDPRFADKFRAMFKEDWRDLEVEWQAYVAALDYGYDVPAMALVHAESAPVESASRRSTIAANHGWQSAGWILHGGETYKVSASGRFQIVRGEETWPCEPGGVTIEYHDGRPTGALIGALVPVGNDASALSAATFAHPTLIGVEGTITPERDAELYVRVNDSPATVGKNKGEVAVRIEKGGK